MRRNLLYVLLVLVCLIWSGTAKASDVVLPAGTLLQCTLNEPNFSSATAEVGDPVLCHIGAVQQFGHSVFPRGSYLVGRLESYKDPGHFVGKGNLKLAFERIGLPDTDVPLPGKVIAVRGYRVDRHGDIVGHGHAKRDAVEWMLPPLWPWKILTLPARGPRPALKGEVPITIRLMDDVSIPRMPDPGWHFFSRPSSQGYAQPGNFVVSGDRRPATSPTITRASATVSGPERPERLTLFALKNETIYAAADYRLEDGRIALVLKDGSEGRVSLVDVDWTRTAKLNSERGVRVTFASSRTAD